MAPNPALSTSFYLTAECTKFRNVDDCSFVRRVFGELCYAALLVVSLVEAVVRTVLALPVSFFALFCMPGPPEAALSSAYDITIKGGRLSLMSVVFCFYALFTNPCCDEIHAKDVFPKGWGR